MQLLSFSSLLLQGLSVFSLLSSTLAIAIPPPTPTQPLDRRADINPTPNAPGDPTNGWQALPAAPSAGVHPTWKIDGVPFVRFTSIYRFNISKYGPSRYINRLAELRAK